MAGGKGFNQGGGHITGAREGLIARVGEEAYHSGRGGDLLTSLGLKLVTERGKGALNNLSYHNVANLYSHVEWHNSNPYIVSSFSVHICQF